MSRIVAVILTLTLAPGVCATAENRLVRDDPIVAWQIDFSPKQFNERTPMLERDYRFRGLVDRLVFPRVDRRRFAEILEWPEFVDVDREVAQILLDVYERHVNDVIASIHSRRPLAVGSKGGLMNGLKDLDVHFSQLIDDILALQGADNPDQVRSIRMALRRQVILPSFTRLFPGYSAMNIAGDDLDLDRVVAEFISMADSNDLGRQLTEALTPVMVEYATTFDEMLNRHLELYRHSRIDYAIATDEGNESGMRRAWRMDRGRWLEQDALLRSFEQRVRSMIAMSGGHDLAALWDKHIDRARFPMMYHRTRESDEVAAMVREVLPELADDLRIQSVINEYGTELERIRREARQRTLNARRNMHPKFDGREPAFIEGSIGAGYEPIPDAAPRFHGAIFEESRLELVAMTCRRIADLCPEGGPEVRRLLRDKFR